MNTEEIGIFCQLNEASKTLLKIAMDWLNHSFGRQYRILKVSGTIAGLANVVAISSECI